MALALYTLIKRCCINSLFYEKEINNPIRYPWIAVFRLVTQSFHSFFLKDVLSLCKSWVIFKYLTLLVRPYLLYGQEMTAI